MSFPKTSRAQLERTKNGRLRSQFALRLLKGLLIDPKKSPVGTKDSAAALTSTAMMRK